ncbi:MAG: hypothetical protein ABIP64_12245 [Burkholderiales bacterium]
MISEKDVYRAAEGLIRNFGADAAAECTQVAERWGQRGASDAAELGLRVRDAILEIRGQQA